MPRAGRTIGVATIAGLLLLAGTAGSAQASEAHNAAGDVRAEVRVEERIEDDRAELRIRKEIEHGDVRLRFRAEVRIDAEGNGDHQVEERFTARLDLRH